MTITPLILVAIIAFMVFSILVLCLKPKQSQPARSPQVTHYTGPTYNRHGREITR